MQLPSEEGDTNVNVEGSNIYQSVVESDNIVPNKKEMGYKIPEKR